MSNESNLEGIKDILEYSLIIENKKLINIMVAITSSEDKKITEEEIVDLTGLDSETVSKSIELLDNSDYITTSMQDISGRSLHKVCQLTEKGEKLLKLLKIE